jgi:hypothetical protein
MSLQYAGILGQWCGRRFWESRQFYSAYVALFISVTNWITIQYNLFLENLSNVDSIFSNVWTFVIAATITFSVVSVLGGHYIHRKRQFKIEQSLAIEENPYLYKAAPGKEKDLMIPIAILQLETLETILRTNGALTEDKRKQFDLYRQELLNLGQGKTLGYLQTGRK